MAASPPLALAWFLLLSRPGLPLSPPQRTRAVPWGGRDVVYVVLLFYFFLPVFVMGFLGATGFFSWLYGPDFPALVRETSDEAVLLRQRAGLWAQTLTAPLVVALTAWLLRALTDARPYQIGLTADRLPRNVLLGAVTALCVGSFTHGVNLALAWLREMGGMAPEEHPLTRAARQGLPWFDWVLLILTATAAAPLLEELLFRGVTQKWLAARPWAGHVAAAVALPLCLYTRSEKTKNAWLLGGLRGVADDLAGPAVFALVMALLYLPYRRFVRSPGGQAVYGTALLFGVAHSHVWPSPVSLFVLGLGLGFVAYRTQSLVPSVVAHGLFNGVACVQLLLGTYRAT